MSDVNLFEIFMSLVGVCALTLLALCAWALRTIFNGMKESIDQLKVSMETHRDKDHNMAMDINEMKNDISWIKRELDNK